MFLLVNHVKPHFHVQVNLPKGYGYVEFKTRADAEKAQIYMDGVSFLEMWKSLI